ncbi:DUF3187 family protein [Shewanella ulleungensis]|uniref:DUF3187 family protein n=1 Tax=Shewanella ulleungensis TaxID=2282699 RepID=A0ABQ2QUP1_9GAMM|nr:DUF3187 family protein [Shewanella ulleungensis]MCL1150907.1 DUF3187 family protein [Shewanella ulleungensis]GGP95284.1 hypothetical protein GCM10009410_31600 [Shewanella ulleungensis]
MLMKKNLLFTLLGLTCLPAAQAQMIDFDDYGPLRVYAQSPMQSINHTPLLRSGFSLPNGQREWYITANIASMWSESDVLLADYYQNAVTGGVKWQMSDALMLDINYRWGFSADNHLDSLTMWFHDAFGFDQNGRQNQAKHQNQIQSKEYGIHIDDLNGETLENALTAYLGYQLVQTERHGLSLGASLYFKSVDSGPFAEDSFAQSIQINYSYKNGPHNVNSSFGVSFIEDTESISTNHYDSRFTSIGIGYEYRTGRHGWLAEIHRYEGLVSWDENFSDASHEALLGYRYYLNTSAIEFTLVENFENMDNSADIAYTLGYRHKF